MLDCLRWSCQSCLLLLTLLTLWSHVELGNTTEVLLLMILSKSVVMSNYERTTPIRNLFAEKNLDKKLGDLTKLTVHVFWVFVSSVNISYKPQLITQLCWRWLIGWDDLVNLVCHYRSLNICLIKSTDSERNPDRNISTTPLGYHVIKVDWFPPIVEILSD